MGSIYQLRNAPAMPEYGPKHLMRGESINLKGYPAQWGIGECVSS